MAKLPFQDEVMVAYIKPKGVSKDRNDNRNCKLEFRIPVKLVVGPARLMKWINANENCGGARQAKCDFEVDSVTIDFAETPGTEVFLCIEHTTIRNFRLQVDKDDPHQFYLKFDVVVQIDKSNCEFILLRVGTQVAMTVRQTQEDLDYAEKRESESDADDKPSDEGKTLFDEQYAKNDAEIDRLKGKAPKASKKKKG